MDGALCALRQFSAGLISDSLVFRAAAQVSTVTRAVVSARNALGENAGEEVSREVEPPDPAFLETSPKSDDENSSPQTTVELQGNHLLQGQIVTELYSWGRCDNYQLGFGMHTGEQLVPRLVPLPHKVEVTSVACGRFHSFATTTCGSVFCWGFGGTTGRLGLDSLSGSGNFIVEPTALPEFGPGRHQAAKIAAGLGHSLALTLAGKMLVWGSNAHGQLGVTQGVVGEGENAHARRPVVIKPSGAFKGEVVRDIAAGSEHSLCVVGTTGGVFVWGSNERGALGLGAPPNGPSGASTPQQLPHLRGAHYVAALSHVSVVLAGHGDAVIFGSTSTRATADGRRMSDASGADARCYTPQRVRRRERKISDSIEADDWQMRRGSVTMGPRLETVALGTDEAFAVDTVGTLWSWSLGGTRPCVADVLNIVPAPPSSPPSGSLKHTAFSTPQLPSQFRSVSVADRRGVVWAVENERSQCLWRLQRRDQAWHAERCDHLAKVAFVACGPEHQTAIISYRRPSSDKNQQHDVICDEDVAHEAGAAQECNTNGAGNQPASLQKICEDRLCQQLSPRNLRLVCEVAWELNRPELLDCAYEFLRANSALLFSRTYLPELAQMPYEVLAAFELSASAQLTAPSEALNAPPGEFPPEHLLQSPDQGILETGSETNMGAVGLERKRRRKKAASDSAVSPQVKPNAKPCKSPKTVPTNGGTPTTTTQTKKTSPVLSATSASGSPKLPATMSSLTSDMEAWLFVPPKARRSRTGSSLCGEETPTHMPKSAPISSPGLKGLMGSNGPIQEETKPATDNSSSSPKTAARPLPTFGDFIKTKSGAELVSLPADSQEKIDDGPSALLSAALRSAQAAGWGSAEQVGEKEAPNLRQILVEEKNSGTSVARARSGKIGEDPSNDPTRCSWGFDAMRSEQPKGRSVYHLQQEEEEEKVRQTQEQEIRDIEAMFAALEVAELAEEQEKLHPGEGSQSTTNGKKNKAQGKKAEAHRDQRGTEKKGIAANDKASGQEARRGSGGGGKGKGGGRGRGRSAEAEAFTVGDRVQRRDKGEDWEFGYVKAVNPLKVTAKDDPNADGYIWDEVRRVDDGCHDQYQHNWWSSDEWWKSSRSSWWHATQWQNKSVGGGGAKLRRDARDGGDGSSNGACWTVKEGE